MNFIVFSGKTIVSLTTTVKDNRIYVRLSSEIKQEFEMAAASRGLTPSARLHSFIVKTVREAKEQSPQIFKSGAEAENKSPETEKPDKVMTLDEAKADDKKKKGKKK